jgi:hypothetical protein
MGGDKRSGAIERLHVETCIAKSLEIRERVSEFGITWGVHNLSKTAMSPLI